MKAWWLLVLAIAVALALGGCMPRHEDAAKAVPDPAHNSRNALDWAGTYEGVTPCADCPGIRLRLTLHADGRYELQRQYLEREAAPQTVQGRFAWSTDGSTVILDAAGQGQQFRVGEGRLLQLNRDGSAPPWSAPQHVLTLQPAK